MTKTDLSELAILTERQRCASCVEVYLEKVSDLPRMRAILLQISQEIRSGVESPRELAPASPSRDTTPLSEVIQECAPSDG
jgi:hypothetical protein